MVTADHGHLEVHGEETMVLGAEPADEALTAALRCAPTVEPRSPGFHLRDGADKERFAEDAAPGAHSNPLRPGELGSDSWLCAQVRGGLRAAVG